MPGQDRRVLILGAGCCGLAAALELTREGVPFTLVEKADKVGGLSPTFHLQGVPVELGPHIYFDKDPDVTRFWRSLVGDKLRTFERRTRLFQAGKFIRSPLSIPDVLIKLGPLAVARILLSFAAAKLRRKPIENARDWVVANFGAELYERFFRTYNEKMWGIPSTDIAPDWAGQRIKSSLLTIVFRSLVRDPAFIVKSFAFPDGGSATISAAAEAIVRANEHATLRLGTAPSRIVRTEVGFLAQFGEASSPEAFSHVISTIHLADLAEVLAYRDRQDAVISTVMEQLSYRNLIVVNLAFAAADFRNMREHWIDIHDPDVKALRVTNFSNYSRVGDDGVAAVGVEYNCFAGDPLWDDSDSALVDIALADLRRMGLTTATPLAQSVKRISRAYPIYFRGYREVLAPLWNELAKVDGLILAGRNALYKWNNMHHSVKTGILAAQNTLGASHDLTLVKGNVSLGKESD